MVHAQINFDSTSYERNIRTCYLLLNDIIIQEVVLFCHKTAPFVVALFISQTTLIPHSFDFFPSLTRAYSNSTNQRSEH
uniref:Uncharacterized protein n=1 Tax=Lepeophtheirus salmonis TaxID=72036 RepID=A0A0K2V1Q1_LEPSM